MPHEPNAGGELLNAEEAMGSSQGSPGTNNFSSQQLGKPTLWVKKMRDFEHTCIIPRILATSE